MIRIDYIINELINKLSDAEIKLIVESFYKKTKK